jgi:hypothetical protein
MADQPQSYANHRRYDPLWHFVGGNIVALGFIGALVHAIRHPDRLLNWAGVVYTLGIVLVVFRARVQTLTVQNRLIRLEMRLRMKDVLPPALSARASELTTSQLVGLRFAGDAELPALVERCLNGQLADGGAVKKEVKNWQADWLRA